MSELDWLMDKDYKFETITIYKNGTKTIIRGK